MIVKHSTEYIKYYLSKQDLEKAIRNWLNDPKLLFDWKQDCENVLVKVIKEAK